MQMRFFSLTLLFVFLAPLCCVLGQETGSKSFCSSRTTAAYHSPECGFIWVVRDPNRISDIHIDHSPEYHTYSRWVISGMEYVLAYRDIDNDPANIALDLYRSSGARYSQIGSLTIGAPISKVQALALVPKQGEQLVIFSQCGQLHCIDIVQVRDDQAKELFEYAGTTIVVRTGRLPSIVATSKSAGLTEQFTWSEVHQQFVKHTEKTLSPSNDVAKPH